MDEIPYSKPLIEIIQDAKQYFVDKDMEAKGFVKGLCGQWYKKEEYEILEKSTVYNAIHGGK